MKQDKYLQLLWEVSVVVRYFIGSGCDTFCPNLSSSALQNELHSVKGLLVYQKSRSLTSTGKKSRLRLYHRPSYLPKADDLHCLPLSRPSLVYNRKRNEF